MVLETIFKMGPVKRIFLTLSFLAFVSSAGGCLTYTIREDMKRNAYFREQEENGKRGLPSFAGPYCFPDPHPLLLRKVLLLTFITFLMILVFRNPIWAAPAALANFAIYPYWYWNTQKTLEMAELYVPKGFDVYFLNAGYLDLTAAILTSLITLMLLTLIPASLVKWLTPRKLP
jgi:hypothetical protein